MNPDQAWQSVQGQLQMEMPRASFDAWVRDTLVVSYDDGVMTIGARNLYARDWLEARLRGSVSDLLTGMLGQTVDVRFVVHNEKLGEGASEDQVGEETNAADTAGDEDEYVEVTGVDPLNEDLTEEALQMLGRELVVAGYTRRHVPESGVKEVLFYACVRQAFFWAGETKRDGITKELRIATADLIRWSVFPRSTWFRQVDKFDWKQDLAGLVERSIPIINGKKKYDYQYYKVGNETRRRRLPNKYRVYVSPRLTRADAAHLYNHLKEQSQQTGLLQAITDITQMTPKEIRDFLPPLGERAPDGIPGLERLYYVPDIARALYGDKGDFPEELEKAAIALNKAIIKSFGTIHVNHFFLYQLAPAYKLTPHQIWLQICACDDAYINDASGEYRDEVIYSYAQLTTMCGMAGTSWKNIRAWLHPDQYPKLTRGGELSLFLRELDLAQTAVKVYGNEKEIKRKFQVRVSFDDIRAPIQMGLTQGDSSGTYKNPIQVGLTEPDSGGTYIGDSGETHEMIQMGLTESDSGGTHSTDSSGTKKLRSLKSPESLNKIITPSTNHAKNAENRGWGMSRNRWNLKIIFEINHVHPKLRQELAKKDVRDLVSWILFAASPQGNKSEPFNFALAQLRSFPDSTGAGSVFDQFAGNLSPEEILQLIDATPQNEREKLYEQKDPSRVPYGDDWKKAMLGATGYNEKIGKVHLALFGEQDDRKIQPKRKPH